MDSTGTGHAQGIEPSTDRRVIEEFFADYDVVARAPGCVFFLGNHSVVYGHAGLYLPIPRYTYVGLKEDRSTRNIVLEQGNPLNWIDATANLESCNDTGFARRVKSNPSLDEQNQHYLLRACEVIRDRFFEPSKKSLGLRIKVFCQQPPLVGMNSSGSTAAALIMALRTYFDKTAPPAELDKARGILDSKTLMSPYLRGSPAFEQLSTLAWFLDDCLHGLGGTAIGSLGALMGSENGLPFLFMAEARSGLSSDALESADDYRDVDPAKAPDQGRFGRRAFSVRRSQVPSSRKVTFYPSNYKSLADLPSQRLDEMSKIKRMAVRLDDQLASGITSVPRWWQDTGIGVVYGGDPKFTRHMLERMGGKLEAIADSPFMSDVLDLALARRMQLNPLESWLWRTATVPAGIDIRQWYDGFVGPRPDYRDEWFQLQWRKQQRKELMMLLMGGTSYLATNALSAPEPYDFARLLIQQQALFSVVGMSRPAIDVMCARFDEYRDRNDRPSFGSTITGGGGGGDIVIFGAIDALENQFDAIFSKAEAEIERLRIVRHETGQVHYRSWTESRVAEPAKVILGTAGQTSAESWGPVTRPVAPRLLS